MTAAMMRSVDPEQFHALLLAAGEGSRLGRIPKGLLRVGNQTLISRQLVALQGAGASRIVVVTGYYFEEIEAEIRSMQNSLDTSVEIVRNEQPEHGQQSSVTLGLQALSQHNRETPVLIALADQPLMASSDYQTCLRAFNNRPLDRSIVYPVYKEQRGNPVVVSAQTIRQVLASGVTCRDFIASHPELVHPFQTDSDHFIFDIDEQKDIETFRLRTGLVLG